MERVPHLGEEGVDLRPGAIVPAAAFALRAPVAALQDQPGARLKRVAEGTAEGQFACPVL